MHPTNQARRKTEVIWAKGVKSVDPRVLVAQFVQSDASFQSVLRESVRILVVGGGKASASMGLGLEQEIKPFLSKTVGSA